MLPLEVEELSQNTERSRSVQGFNRSGTCDCCSRIKDQDFNIVHTSHRRVDERLFTGYRDVTVYKIQTQEICSLASHRARYTQGVNIICKHPKSRREGKPTNFRSCRFKKMLNCNTDGEKRQKPEERGECPSLWDTAQDREGLSPCAVEMMAWLPLK